MHHPPQHNAACPGLIAACNWSKVAVQAEIFCSFRDAAAHLLHHVVHLPDSVHSFLRRRGQLDT